MSDNKYYYIIVEGGCYIAQSEAFASNEERDEEAAETQADITHDSVLFWADIKDGELKVGEFTDGFEDDELTARDNSEEYDSQEWEEDAESNL